MKWKEADRLFVKLMEEVERKQKLPLRMIDDGTSPTLLRHVPSYAVELVTEHVSESGVAIICVHEDELHFTLVNKVTRKKSYLFDSGASNSFGSRNAL